MMGSKARHFAPLVNVSLEDLVPADHFYPHYLKEHYSTSYAVLPLL
jgi:hypothetical protein